MLAIQPPSSSSSQNNPKTIQPSLLPTKIHHNGPIPISKKHWNPQTPTDPKAAPTAYIRGRKLQGRTVKLPEGYEGVVLQKTDKILPIKPQERGEEEEEEDEKPVEVKIMETKGKFDEVMVWGHEALPGDEDVYVKGIEEWIGFAEAMHSYDSPTTEKTTAS